MTAATIGALVVVLVLFFALLSIRLHVGLALMVSAPVPPSAPCPTSRFPRRPTTR